MLLNCGVGEDSWESLGLQGDQTSWSSNTLATWCKELTQLKRPWCWEKSKVREGDNRGWDGWTALPTQWTWVWVDSSSWWWIGRLGMLWSMGSQSWTWLSYWTELNWWPLRQLPRLLSGKESACQCRSCRFRLWGWKIPCRSNWQPPAVFLPGEFHGQRSLIGDSL